MILAEILDVTKIEPRLKHPTIFQCFDALSAGETFTILNDHDPKPLYYQLLGERGNTFTWNYLEQGPNRWRVALAKPAPAAKGETVGQIVAKDIRKAEVFKKLGIDFCCGGKKSVKQACEEVGITQEQLEVEMKNFEENSREKAGIEFNTWDLDFLADYIVNIHHRYVRDNATMIKELVVKVANRHGDQHPELVHLSVGVQQCLADLLSHLEKEEQALFPYVKELVAKKKQGARFKTGFSVASPVQAMETEHERTGEELHAFRELTNDYALPANACNSYAFLFSKLQEFEADLLKHIHLENNILFPKALGLEQELAA
ncbi:iron-sulfur cluster repair di-iron protein [Niastella koreensis]|uniref:Iron-sulfur cluster repair di-iron protein n=2 Tax=Niastella koreensis TaxID=354356 RepID=G8TDJ7_NIAKG|nr:iron-sulfur cluster repair di-iron protein [Niastella koreensis]AEW00447.1 iron-sulfur cluster repair di-iron protein [Niastella koreensis GR20-10]OQP52312.1 iron-sulfur cluster repair di-iron protein [Niastella koreensis]